ncbi:phage major capsid protein [Sediminibacillus halophilus]|uniref:Phage major capsid protein, HK97 family n=1 Tax=Sediminibacillus halophilus TaxID=482461 RepID=A0A1G9QUY6_9BACI|nr:phage major capsid protein [Sediminibacillus halophilus]SDM14826.1 phage major capsid protein, HK97 family [Sediminibacillus halophilus]
MPMRLKGKMDNFQAKKEAYMELVKAEEQDQEKLAAAWDEMQNALAEDLTEKITAEVRTQQMDAQILSARGQNVLTSEERKFFNEVVTSGGFDENSILPVTTQERVFEDLVEAHPLLQAIGLRDLGAVTRFIKSDPNKAYAWGKLFGEIKGQISAAFTEEEIGQLKLTAFAVIPKDMLDLGPVWVERYVRTLLVESYSVGLEYGLVNGRGPAQNEPIGLMKNVSESGAVTTKSSTGTLTFAPSEKGEVVAGELHDVIKALSTDAKNKARKVMNKIVMVVNPVDSISVQARNTIQTANGQWVMSLPYNIKPIESEEVPVGKALFFVQGKYLAALAGGYKTNKFDQTLAIEDAMLYTIKQFANGKPEDNKTALVYDLDIDFNTGSTTTTTTTTSA